MQIKKGFTLIELLVVIAIIGILSGLIIVSMGGAQDAAKAARIKSAMDQFRSNAEIYKLTNGNYGTTVVTMNAVAGTAACTAVATSLIASGTDGKALCDDIQSQGVGGLTLYAAANATAYCIMKVLPGTGAGTWCVDSKGNVGSTNIGCDATNYDCLP